MCLDFVVFNIVEYPKEWEVYNGGKPYFEAQNVYGSNVSVVPDKYFFSRVDEKGRRVYVLKQEYRMEE